MFPWWKCWISVIGVYFLHVWPLFAENLWRVVVRRAFMFVFLMDHLKVLILVGKAQIVDLRLELTLSRVLCFVLWHNFWLTHQIIEIIINYTLNLWTNYAIHITCLSSHEKIGFYLIKPFITVYCCKNCCNYMFLLDCIGVWWNI